MCRSPGMSASSDESNEQHPAKREEPMSICKSHTLTNREKEWLAVCQESHENALRS